MTQKYRLKIKEKREEKGVKQLELAQKTGIAPSSIARYEAEKRVPNLHKAFLIAKALECSMEELIELT